MFEDIVELEIIQAGRPTGQYRPLGETLILEKIVYPEFPLPFDLAILPKTLTTDGEHLQVFLLGEISHPPQTKLSARILGGIQNGTGVTYLLAIPSADLHFAELSNTADISESIKQEISHRLLASQQNGKGLAWLSRETVKPLIKDAYLNYRLAEQDARRHVADQISWRPIDRAGRIVGYTEAEHYSDAEFTYFQLPYRFQGYMDMHLSNDERILYALARPAIRSKRQSSLFGRKTIQEGVLILTDQRLIHLVELMPPDSSGVRYGFHVHMGILERLEGVALERLGEDRLLLQTCWTALEGSETVEWEFPIQILAALKGLVTILEKFVMEAFDSRALRRAMLPPIPEKLPPLKDPAANDPNELDPLRKRFSSLLPDLLLTGENAYAWALWPAWFEAKSGARLLLVTDRRVLVVLDPAIENSPKLDLALQKLTTISYVASILKSHLDLSFIENGRLLSVSMPFPYPAEYAFHQCFEAMRRCLAVLPIA